MKRTVFAFSVLAIIALLFGAPRAHADAQRATLGVSSAINDTADVTLTCTGKVTKEVIKPGMSVLFYNDGPCWLSGVVKTATTAFPIPARAVSLSLSRVTALYITRESAGIYIFK